MNVGENLKHVLELLGKDYSAKQIDGEMCAYRKYNEQYDVEISGCNRKNRPFYVYVWDISNGIGVGAKCVDKSGALNTEDELVDKLVQYENKYS